MNLEIKNLKIFCPQAKLNFMAEVRFDFLPLRDQEISVNCGQKVLIRHLHGNRCWVKDLRTLKEGFVPNSVLEPCTDSLKDWLKIRQQLHISSFNSRPYIPISRLSSNEVQQFQHVHPIIRKPQIPEAKLPLSPLSAVNIFEFRPEFVEPLKNLQIPEGKDAMLICKLIGNPR